VRLWASLAAAVWQRSNRLLRQLLGLLLVAMAAAVVIFATAGGLPPLEAFYFVVSTLTTVGYGDISMVHASAPLLLFNILLMLGGAILMALVYAFVIDLVVSEKLERVLGIRAAGRRHHVVVVGLGSVGYHCALELTQLGIPVVVVDPNEHTRYAEAARAAHLPVVLADAQSESGLSRAGIKHARALLCATSDDQINVEVALLARGLHPDLHVVVRVFDPLFATQVQEHLGIGATFSAAVLAAPGFAAAALGHAGVVVPPPQLPGVSGVPLCLRPVAAATSHLPLCAPGEVPLGILHGDGHCTAGPLCTTQALAPGDRVLIAVTPATPR
jgi:voltage-gated potassium channel Kch